MIWGREPPSATLLEGVILMFRCLIGACALGLLMSCAVSGADFDDLVEPAPVGGEPSVQVDTCRTDDDCMAGHRCVATEGRYPLCVKAEADASPAQRGPKGQPPPPPGLLEGAPRFGPRTGEARR